MDRFLGLGAVDDVIGRGGHKSPSASSAGRRST